MGYQFTIDGVAGTGVNNVPATGAVAVFNIIQMLIQNGYVAKADSDGTTFSSTGVQVTGGGSGAHGLGNTNAWRRVQSPDGTHEITFQRGTTNLLWRIKFSHSAKFTGGSPGATQTPSATDEVVHKGGGTDASPTFVTCFGTDGAYHLHCGGDTSFPYDWWYTCTNTAGGGTTSRGLFFNMARGSYSGDAAPYTFDFGNTAAWLTSFNPSGYWKKGLTGEAWVTYFPGITTFNGTVSIPSSLGLNPNTSNPQGFRIQLGRAGSAANPGPKGEINTQSAYWQCVSRNQFDYEDVTGPAWVASTVYATDVRVSNGGNVYLCLTGGTSAGSGGPTGTLNSITDNTCTWMYLGPVARYTAFDNIMLRSPLSTVLF